MTGQSEKMMTENRIERKIRKEKNEKMIEDGLGYTMEKRKVV